LRVSNRTDFGPVGVELFGGNAGEFFGFDFV